MFEHSNSHMTHLTTGLPHVDVEFIYQLEHRSHFGYKIKYIDGVDLLENTVETECSEQQLE